MNVSRSELISVLRQFNPWWSGNSIPDLPGWKRAAFREIADWVSDPSDRALLLSGARQVGKTTLFLQVIERLVEKRVPPQNILYVTFDHPLLKLIGIEGVLQLWDDYEPERSGIEYLFLDEIQSVKDWQVWLKHQVDFLKRRHIAVTGSAMTTAIESAESGVGRWYTIKLATLSFFEYLNIRNTVPSDLPELSSLTQLFDYNERRLLRITEAARPLVPLFHEYILRGGFPRIALEESITMGQKILREDIVDKVLKRDMTALFGVRRVLELERTFLYLCLHDGGLLDAGSLAKNLQVKKPTAINFISLLESSHLIYRLMPFGYGKEVLRGRPKIYLADPAIAPSVMLTGRALLEDDTKLGFAVEAAAFKHLFSRFYRQSIAFSYWQGDKEREVDVVATIKGQEVPFEIKYKSSAVETSDLKGLISFCSKKKPVRAYVFTGSITDFGKMNIKKIPETQVIRVPVHLACYWLGQSEVEAYKE